MSASVRSLMVAASAVASLSFPLASAAAAFQNGSFESPGVGPNGFLAINGPAQAPTGWDPGGNLSGVALFYEGNGRFGTPSQDGINMIGFGGSGATGASLSQTFDTVASVSYTVSYYITAQQLGNGPQSFMAEALSGAVSLGGESASIPVKLEWVEHSFSFVATGSSTTLRFTDTSNGSAAASINWALDNVTVTGAVPEPGTVALMLSGLAVCGVAARRRGLAQGK